MRTFIRFSSPSCCDKHSPRTFCRLICLLNSLCLMSYSHCWGFTAVLTLLWCCCWYNHSGTIKISKDLAAPVFCSEHYLLLIPLWKKVLPSSALGSSLVTLPMIHSESDTSQIYHTHVSRPWGTCEHSLHQWRTPTSAFFIYSTGVQWTCPAFWTYHRPAGASQLSTVLDLNKMCPGKLSVW